MSTITTAATQNIEASHGYPQLEQIVRDTLAAFRGPLFRTTARGKLFAAYLSGMPDEHRQHYTCHACRHFIERYLSLTMINGAGVNVPVLISLEVPAYFKRSFDAMFQLVSAAAVTGVFVDSHDVWGVPRTGVRTHLSAAPHPSLVHKDPLKTAAQKESQYLADFKLLAKAVSTISKPLAVEAHRILAAGLLANSSASLGQALWFKQAHEALEPLKGKQRGHLMWRLVAEAPIGFCHVRSNVIGTLFDDLLAGKTFASIERAWRSKMDPMQYQRPQAAPTEGALARAEKIFETLQLGPALERRYATLEEVTAIWRPRSQQAPPTGGKLFGDLKPKSAAATFNTAMPPRTMTWVKFARDVLPGAFKIEYLNPTSPGNYYGLLTAVHPDAPPILQWDGLPNQPRNPVSWYVHQNGTMPSTWNLRGGSWSTVTAVMLRPYRWQVPDICNHLGEAVLLALEGARPNVPAESGLFPVCMRSELHEVRSVIEAYSKSKSAQQHDRGTANGVMFEKSDARQTRPIRLRVYANGPVPDEFDIDRWE